MKINHLNLLNHSMKCKGKIYIVNGKKYCVGEKKTKARKIRLRRTRKR